MTRQARHATSAKQDTRAQYNTGDARSHFCQLLERVRSGEEIVIARAGDPIAKLIPYGGGQPTRPGVFRAHVVIHDATPAVDEQPAGEPLLVDANGAAERR